MYSCVSTDSRQWQQQRSRPSPALLFRRRQARQGNHIYLERCETESKAKRWALWYPDTRSKTSSQEVIWAFGHSGTCSWTCYVPVSRESTRLLWDRLKREDSQFAVDGPCGTISEVLDVISHGTCAPSPPFFAMWYMYPLVTTAVLLYIEANVVHIDTYRQEGLSVCCRFSRKIVWTILLVLLLLLYNFGQPNT